MNKWSLSKCEKHTVEIGAHLFWSVPCHCLELRSCTFFSFPRTSQCMTWHYPDCWLAFSSQRLFGPGLLSLGTPPTLSGILRLRPNHCSCSNAAEWFIDFSRQFYCLCPLGGQFMTFPSLNNCGFNSAHSHWTNWLLSSIDQYFTLWPLWTRRGEGKISICQQWKRKTLLVPLPAAQTQLSLGIRDASARVGLVSFWAPILDYIWNNSPEPWALIQDATRQLWECEERAKSRTLTIEGARQGGV